MGRITRTVTRPPVLADVMVCDRCGTEYTLPEQGGDVLVLPWVAVPASETAPAPVFGDPLVLCLPNECVRWVATHLRTLPNTPQAR